MGVFLSRNIGWRGGLIEAPAITKSLEHDPEKWIPVFGEDHAPTISWSGMTIRRKNHPAPASRRLQPPAHRRHDLGREQADGAHRVGEPDGVEIHLHGGDLEAADFVVEGE